jgi:hypothetical protein
MSTPPKLDNSRRGPSAPPAGAFFASWVIDHRPFFDLEAGAGFAAAAKKLSKISSVTHHRPPIFCPGRLPVSNKWKVALRVRSILSAIFEAPQIGLCIFVVVIF